MGVCACHHLAARRSRRIAFVCWEIFADLRGPLVPIHLFKETQWLAMICLIGMSCSVYCAFPVVFPQIVFTLYVSTDLVYGGLLPCLPNIGTNIRQISWLLSGHIGKQKFQFTGAVIVGGALLADRYFQTSWDCQLIRS